jgi:hypothetical protein
VDFCRNCEVHKDKKIIFLLSKTENVDGEINGWWKSKKNTPSPNSIHIIVNINP